MDLRDRTGAISPAEGCMFFAMLLFAALLVTLIVLAAIRFQDRPSSEEMAEPVVGLRSPVVSPDWRLTTGDRRPIAMRPALS